MPIASASASPPLVVVMGVSGCGKSTVGEQLAQVLGLRYLEGDEFHSDENVARMASGVALTDADRQQWLELLSDKLATARAQGYGLVVSCSALKRSYRDILRREAPELVFIHLHGTRELLEQRTSARFGHFMPASLLASQLDALQAPAADERVIAQDIAQNPQDIVRHAVAAVSVFFPNFRSASTMPQFKKVTLFTDTDGRARFREDDIPLEEGTPQSRLSSLFTSGGYLLRESPVGYRSQFHCTTTPQWVFILRGQMEVALQDGSSRVFGPGEHFYSNDTVPAGATFDPALHGHWSRQVGPDPLQTLFVRA